MTRSRARDSGATHVTRSADDPLEDHTLSPYTGWTRTHWERHVDKMLAALRRYGSPGHAQILPPGPDSWHGPWSDGLEGFARSFLMASYRLAGAGGADPDGLAEWYARGLAAGADPASPEHWPTFAQNAQAKVEAASIAIALHETRPWIWDRLDDRVRQQLVEWLDDIIGDEFPPNNWIWFQNIVEAFLRSVGGPWSEEDLQRNFASHEAFYTSDGWYSDGGQRAFDYYSGWALQFYPFWWCRMAPDHPLASRLDRYRERLRLYLADLVNLIGSDGAPLFQGRSLAYRFAMLAPLWTGVLFDATPLTPGQTRRVASGVLRYFAQHDAPDEEGLLKIGWHGEYTLMKQRYTGPGSPYWASKGVAGLLLPPDHPVWTDVEAPVPLDGGDVRFVIAPSGWLVSGTGADGIVRVFNHGGDHAAPGQLLADDVVYGKVGYATHTAPLMGPQWEAQPFDSSVVLLDADGRASHRRALELVSATSNVAVSRSRAHWLDLPPGHFLQAPVDGTVVGPSISVASVVRGAREVRLVHVDSGAQATESLRLRAGGWSLSADTPPSEVHGPVWAAASTDNLASTIIGLRGFDESGVLASAGGNPFGQHTAVPWLATTAPVRPGEIYAALVVLAGTNVVPADSTAADGISVEVLDDRVIVSWPDGTAADEVTLSDLGAT